MSGWKRILDSGSIGTAIPGRTHSHYMYSASDAHYNDTDGGTCNGADASNEPDCSMQGGIWTPAPPTWTGGIYNSVGDINGLHTVFGAPTMDVYTNTDNAHPDHQSLGKLNHLVYLTTFSNRPVWDYTSASTDSNGAKKMIGLIIDPHWSDALSPDGENPGTPGPYIPVGSNGMDTQQYKYRVLTRGYIALNLRQVFATTDDTSETNPMQVGDNIYMSLEDGKLTYTPPTVAGEVVRIVGQIVGFRDPIDGVAEDKEFGLIYFNPSPVWLEVS